MLSADPNSPAGGSPAGGGPSGGKPAGCKPAGSVPPLWPGTRRVPAEDPFAGRTRQDAWLLAYAGWYRHYLRMQDTHDHRARAWAHDMVEAVLTPRWWGLSSRDPDAPKPETRLREGFRRLRQTFESQAEIWLQRAAESLQTEDPDDPLAKTPTVSADKEASGTPDQPHKGTSRWVDVQLDLFA